MARQSDPIRLECGIKIRRHERIVQLVGEEEELTLGQIAERVGHVSVVTVRRDVAELSRRGLLTRIRGGAIASRGLPPRSSAETMRAPDPLGFGEVDALIMPPVGGAGVATLRNWARRRRIPLVAEAFQQEGGVCVGHDNLAVGRRLGARAGALLNDREESVDLLLVSYDTLAITRLRCDGFLRGFADMYRGRLHHWRIEGRGDYQQSRRVAREAFAARPSINVAFGVNDHSVLAVLDAATECRKDISAFSVGGEGESLFSRMMEDPRLQACAALFPELAGIKAIDMIAEIQEGQTHAGQVTLPYAIVTRDNLHDYYMEVEGDWRLRPHVRNELAPETAMPVTRAQASSRIGFVPQFPMHDWYRNMIRAMKARCEERGFELKIAPPRTVIAEEVNYLRECIARNAAQKVSPGDTIAINTGPISKLMVDHLPQDSQITVVTNSLDILYHLTGKGSFKVILTAGEYQERDRCMVGPSIDALLGAMRIDKAFLSVDGFSCRFGPSAADEKLAMVARRFCAASRRIHIMADHSLFGAIANHRIVSIDHVDEVITDRGNRSSDWLDLTAAGVVVTLADGDLEDEGLPRLG